MKATGCIIKITMGLAAGYLLLLTLMFFNQEKLIFHANPLPADHQFTTEIPYQEVFLPTPDGEKLHGLYFKSAESKGTILYWHGNSGNLQGWSYIAPLYTRLGYDLFLVDYRGFGKSSGAIISQEQVFADAQLSYDFLKEKRPESEIIIAGYSIGTGIAAWLAKENQPRKLMLQAPYANLKEMTQYRFPFVPTFLLRFEFDTQSYIQQVQCPIWMFHGTADEVIPFHQGRNLSRLLKPTDKFLPIYGQKHGRFNDNSAFRKHLVEFLN